VTRNDAERSRERWVNYYGPPGTLPRISYHLALDTNATPESVFDGKVVFVGARLFTLFANQRKDEFYNPYSYWSANRGFMPGVEVQATIFLNLFRSDWLLRWPRATEASVLALLGAAFGLGLMRLRPWKASAAALLGIAVIMAASWLLFIYGRTWFPWLIAIAQMFAALLYAVVFNSFQLYLEKRLYEQTVALYLSPKLVRKFTNDPQFMEGFLKPTAHKERLTFLFSDIANFTSISEGMDSDDLAQAMNAYFEKAITLCIHPTDGTVVKYIGDAIYALWNAPDLQPDHALRACRAALSFRDQGLHYMNGQPLITRIGLHTGVANVGNFGSAARFDYTALGENVNLASRMEGLNKYLGTTLLVTGDTYREVADQIVSRFCGRFRLKGFEKAVEAHELIGFEGQVSRALAWRESFGLALELFRKREFEKAEMAFRSTLDLKAEDGPSKFYLEQIAELRLHPPVEEWIGEIELKEK
jgi:adenylate cyclase